MCRVDNVLKQLAEIRDHDRRLQLLETQVSNTLKKTLFMSSKSYHSFLITRCNWNTSHTRCYYLFLAFILILILVKVKQFMSTRVCICCMFSVYLSILPFQYQSICLSQLNYCCSALSWMSEAMCQSNVITTNQPRPLHKGNSKFVGHPINF